MKKILSTILFVFVLFSVSGIAQWQNLGAWPDASVLGQLHGVAVDPDGKVWAGNFSAENYVIPGTTDTIKSVRLIRVYNADGTPAPFSPIWKLTIPGGTTDTLKNSMRGMRPDQNGNIVFVEGGQNMYRINYQTGEGMNKVALNIGTSPTAPGISNDGKIFVGPVVNAGFSIQEYDTDFNFIGNAFTIIPSGFSRSIEVSPDGNTIYFPSYTRKIIIVYQRPDELSAFDSIGTIMDGVACESITRNRATGNLWVAAGSYNDRPDSSLGIWTPNMWYEYNVGTSQVLDSLKWEFVTPLSPTERPRGIDFSPDGLKAYFGCFGGSGYMLMQKAEKLGGDVKDNELVVNGYKLSQNYPNPFNPSTKISYELPQAGFVTLKVYDLLGREVATLVNNEVSAGSYTVNFDASNLSSGTYIYSLSVNGTSISNKMILMK
jgi:hypothetical protein